MQKAIKVRLYPNASQRMALEAQFGMVRFVYNKSLAIINHFYKYHKQSVSAYHDIKKLLPVAKNNTRYAFLKNADAQSLQQACINLDKAFKSFFNKKQAIQTSSASKVIRKAITLMAPFALPKANATGM